MADKLTLKAKAIYLGGYDISAESNDIKLDGDIENVPADNFASGAKDYEPGFETVKGSIGVMLPITQDWEKVLFDARGTGQVLSFLVEGNAAGSVSYALSGLSTKHHPGGQVGGLAGSLVDLMSRGTPLLRGKNLEAHPPTQRSASANTAGLQFAGGVASGKKLWIAYHVLEMTATSLAAVVQRDDNSGFTTPVTAITLAAATGLTAELASVAGPITDDWFRLALTLTGAGNYKVAAILAVQ